MITSKKLNKKLTLKKETIVNLKNGEMKGIKGGTHFTVNPCPGTTIADRCSTPFNCSPI
jgi:natural product precursor